MRLFLDFYKRAVLGARAPAEPFGRSTTSPQMCVLSAVCSSSFFRYTPRAAAGRPLQIAAPTAREATNYLWRSHTVEECLARALILNPNPRPTRVGEPRERQ